MPICVLSSPVEEERLNSSARPIGVTFMNFDNFSFGAIQIDGIVYEHDVIIDRGEIRKRNKKPSKKFQEDFGHTPLSIEEEIPWKCQQLVIGSGAYGRLPVMREVKQSATKSSCWCSLRPRPSRY